MNTKRNRLNRSVIPLFVLAVVTLVVLSLILIPARMGATPSLAAGPQQGMERVTVRQSGSTGEDVPLAAGEWAQASLEISGAPDEAVISYVQVKYSVVYPQASDLEVQLLSSGTEATHTLWDKGSAEGAELTQSAGEITAFQGVPVNGTWSLAVKGGEQEGYIDGFSINVYYEKDRPVMRLEGGTPGQPGFMRLPEGAAPASPSQDEDDKSGAASEEGSSVVPLHVPPGATIIKTEDFEGTFPNTLWYVVDQSNDGYQRWWDDVSCDPCGGDWAAWPADGGVDRVNVCAGDNYPNNMETWMRYGPFDLRGANDAGTEFGLWREIEEGYDYMFVGVSHDGSSFDGYFLDGFVGCTLYNFNYLGWVGDDSVWVAWEFYSDESVNYKGPFVDDIVIWKWDEPPPCRVWIEPPHKDVVRGSTFTFDVWIDDVNNLGGFQFDLDYDPNIVHVDVSAPHDGADPGPFPGSTGRSVFELGPTVNNTTGDMTYGVYTTGSAPGPSGSGLLATIHFEAMNEGENSPLDLNNVEVTDTYGNLLSCNVQDGTVTVGPTCPADVNGDGVIDIVDIMIVVGCWGQTCPCP
jgi:hypothetical protein